MTTELPPTDPEIFRHGKSLLAADTYECSADGFEAWVVALRSASGQRVDWHCSGGVAQVLVLGDFEKAQQAVRDVPCPGRIMRLFEPSAAGLYRGGVTTVPEGTLGGFFDGTTTQYVVQRNEDPDR
jgi:hypothetical protein